MHRRALIAGLAATLAAPSGAKLARPDVRIKARPIRWPSGDGGTLHGFMAIPARARGRQPSVLILPAATDPPAYGAELCVATAQAGLIGCTPDPATIAAAAKSARDLEATIAWLAGNAYATGAVGLLATGTSAALAPSLAAHPAVRATVLLAPAAILTPDTAPGTLLTLDATDWAPAWARAMAFLREHLQ